MLPSPQNVTCLNVLGMLSSSLVVSIRGGMGDVAGAYSNSDCSKEKSEVGDGVSDSESVAMGGVPLNWPWVFQCKLVLNFGTRLTKY